MMQLVKPKHVIGGFSKPDPPPQTYLISFWVIEIGSPLSLIATLTINNDDTFIQPGLQVEAYATNLRAVMDC